MLRGRALLVVIALCGAACASDGTVGVELDEFSLSPAATSAEGGEVVFEVSNVGEIGHDFLVLRTDRAPDALPVTDGEVDLEGLEVVAAIEAIDPGATRELQVQLSASDHVLICAIPGHYQSGMYAGFDVS